nr:hypothetical protein [uncultured Oscillibacter sp.]
MDDGMDYDVQTKVSFRLDFDGSGEFNMLLLPDVQKQFVQHVKEVYEQDNTLGSGYVSSDLNFQFDGRTVKLEYTFTCHDENKAEAESFSAYCVRCVQKELEEFGCKVQKIDCKAEEAEMAWLDQLEDAIFGPRESAQKQLPAEDKSSKKVSSKKKNARQER